MRQLIITKTRQFKYIENFTTRNWKFSDKKTYIFHIFLLETYIVGTLEPSRRSGSNEYPQSMFLSRNKKTNVCPWKPLFYYTKVGFHYENLPIQIYWKFYHWKIKKNQIKSSDNFLIPAQNIDCGYSLEPPRRGGSNEYPQSMFLRRNKKK